MRLICVIIMVMAVGVSLSRSQGLADTLLARLNEQCYEFPQEKIHLSTDRNHYMGGDTVWLRGFVVSAATHEPVSASKYIYVELRSPYNTVERRVKVMERGGVYSGYVPLDARIPEGDYTLVAYTTFMNSAGEAYFFKKPLGIRNAYSLRLEMAAAFEWEDGGERLLCRIDFRDRQTGADREREFTYRTAGDTDWKPSWRRKGTETVRLDRAERASGYLLVMCDDYARYLRLPGDTSAYDVSFHPEGGYLVPGEECRVAFKAIDGRGLGIPVEGRVVDSRGNEAARFESLHLGMGSFRFTPLPGEAYRAECTAAGGARATFALPAANDSAAAISADMLGDSVIRVSVRGCCPPGAVVAMQERGLLLYAARLGGRRELSVGCRGVPDGVVQVLLLDGGLNALSERLLFARGARADSATASTPRPTYGSRDKIRLDIRLGGYRDPSGSVAVAVTDGMFGDETRGPNVLTSLLLQSELRGLVEDPAYYFERDDSTRRAALDALLMTQGWRRYDVPASLRGETQYPSAAIEKSQQISGTVKSLWRGRPLKDATVRILSKKIGFARAVKTDRDGRFAFNGFDNVDNVTYDIEAINKDGKPEENMSIDPESFPPINIPNGKVDYGISPVKDENSEDENETVESAQRMRLTASGTYNILLDELVVERNASQYGSKSMSEMLAYRSLNSEDMEKKGYTSIEDAIRRIPGVVISAEGNVYYRNRPVSFVIDDAMFSYDGGSSGDDALALYGETLRRRSRAFSGIGAASLIATSRALSSYSVPSRGVLREIEDMYPFQMIERIDFIQPSNSLIFTGGGGGTVVITTKEGGIVGEKRPYSLKSFRPLGYQAPAEFYSPKYTHDFGNASNGTDLRSTVYWNPDIKISSDGSASVEFYANDNRRTFYNIVIEGVTQCGEIIYSKSTVRKR